MPKQNFFVTEEELDNFQIQLLQKRIDRSMVVSGCAGSGKSILALWKAKQIQALQEGATYKFIVFTNALHRFMSDGIRTIGLNDDSFMIYNQWKQQGCPPADYIIVDEVQDFTREEISQLKNAAQKAFFFWGDSAQSLYTTKDGAPTQDILSIGAEAGIQPEPLIFNYRLPAKIARLAAQLGNDEELVRRCTKEGSEIPRILHYKNLEEQLDVAMEQINNRQITDAAILLPKNDKLQMAYEYLRSKGHNVEIYINDKKKRRIFDLDFSSTNPKLMTYHSAKGLQFEAVFLPECDLPEVMGVKPLYVAISRSYRYLFIMYSHQLSRYFDAVPKNFYSTSLEEDKIEL